MPTVTHTVAEASRRQRPSWIWRRLGYTVALVVNVSLFIAVNRVPGWEAVPFLTDDFARVLSLVNASVMVTVAANAFYLLSDPRWLKALGDVSQNVVGIAAMVRIWQVFPFDFGGSTVGWDIVARWVVGVGIAGSVIGVITNSVSFVRAVRGPRR